MLLYGLFLVFIVTSSTLSSIISDDICSNRSEKFGGRIKRQVTNNQFQGKCVLPSYPAHGSYTVGGTTSSAPGQEYSFVYLNVTCYPGFMLEEEKNPIFCHNGHWFDTMPKCVRFCRLSKHVSVTYYCYTAEFSRGSRECGPVVPTGIIVRPECKKPNYYYPGILEYMFCLGGTWNHIATCKPDCGKITPVGTPLISGGKSAKRGELPWHAGIYTKTSTPFMQICGGSLISTTAIISAAHCFWSDVNKLLPASDYAVAVGKIYRPWSNSRDIDAQTSDVSEIKVTQYFQGAATNYQDDIALVIVETPFTYQVFIRPVCLDFDEDFDKQQLSDTNLGKVAGWGRVDKNGEFSQVLKVVELPFVSVEKCYAISPPSFRAMITNDKICAGYTNGTALCQGDSGGGLAFPTIERGVQRYFLRGVVSTAPTNENLCSTNSLTTFTRIFKHDDFIKSFLFGSSAELPSEPSIVSSDNNILCPADEWQCDESSCISLNQKCDGMADCFDGSDERDCGVQTRPQCLLPSYPEHGSYTVDGVPNGAPGQAYRNVVLNITCDSDFEVENQRSSLICRDGVWSDTMPKCVRTCRLQKHDSVEYRCPSSDSTKFRECGPRVPTGATVTPVCKPQYRSDVLSDMKCVDGNWSYIATCTPESDSQECGTITPQGTTLILGWKMASKGDLPWYALIYTKLRTINLSTCGGTLISTKTVITSRMCIMFDLDTISEASRFAVAVGKTHLPWTDPGDPDAQKSDIAEILVPPNYKLDRDHYKNDIVLVIVTTPFKYTQFVRPVCLDFDPNFEQQQLQHGNLGKVASWVLESRELQVSVIPYVNQSQCIEMWPPKFRPYISSEKICAGHTEGTEVCRDEFGSGLVFPSNVSNVQRYYLRGVVSTFLTGGKQCNREAVIAFTRVSKFENFIKENLDKILVNRLSPHYQPFKGCLKGFMNVTDKHNSINSQQCPDEVENVVYFGPSNYSNNLRVLDNFNVGSDISISMEIKPRNSTGLLLSVHGKKDFLILELLEDQVVVNVENGMGPFQASYKLGNKTLCDGNWHRIHVVKSNHVASVGVDGHFSKPSIGQSSSTDTSSAIFIGGHQWPVSRIRGVKSRRGFTGCIRNIAIKEEPVQFSLGAARGNVHIGVCPND